MQTSLSHDELVEIIDDLLAASMLSFASFARIANIAEEQANGEIIEATDGPLEALPGVLMAVFGILEDANVAMPDNSIVRRLVEQFDR